MLKVIQMNFVNMVKTVSDIENVNVIHSSAEKAGCTFGMYVDNVTTDLSLM